MKPIVFAAMFACLAGSANAAVFDLRYTTFADSLFPAVTVAARLTTDDGTFYGAPGSLLVTAISGTRDGVAIDGLVDPFSEIFVPASPFYVDSFGISFSVGGVDYNFVRDNSSFYQEFATPSGSGLSEGRIVLDRDVSLTPAGGVPEPTTWALMAGGLALTGVALRRRQLAA